MSTKFWKGGAGWTTGAATNDEGNFEFDDSANAYADSNWVDESGAGVAKPASADILIFGMWAGIVPADYVTTTEHVIADHWSVIYNLDQSALDLGNIKVTESFTGALGYYDSDTGIYYPLKYSIADGSQMEYRSEAASYIECAATGENIPLLIFDTTSGSLRISSTGNGCWDKAQILDGGTLTLAEDTICNQIDTFGADFTLDIGAGCVDSGAASIDLNAYGGGSIYCNSPLGEVVNAGPTIEYGKTDFTPATDLDIDDLLNISGTFNWRAAGVLKSFLQVGGNIIGYGDGNKTIGGVDSTAYEILGGLFDLSQVRGDVEFRTGCSIKNTGGEFKPCPRNLVTW